MRENKLKLAPDTFQSFTSISNIELNNSGELIALTATKPDIDGNIYRSRVNVVESETGELVFSTDEGRESTPVWVDDESLIYISYSNSDKDKKLKLVYWRRPSVRETLIELNKPVLGFRCVRNGLILALLRDPVDDQDPDYVYSDKIPIWFDAVGFVAGYRNRLYLIDHRSGYMEPLTSKDVNVVAFDYEPDRGIAALALSDDPERPYLAKIAVMDLDSGAIDYLANGESYYVENLSVKDNILAVKAHRLERGFATHLRLLLMDLDSGEVIAYESPKGRGLARRVYHDLRGPNASIPRVRIRGRNVYYLLSDGGRFTLYQYSIDSSEHKPVIDGDFVIDEFDVSQDQRVIAYIKTDPVNPAELYVFRDGVERQVTYFNKFLKRVYRFVKPERFVFEASDGELVEGWIMIPDGVEGERKIPAILNIHGGPKSKFGYTFMFEHQLLASNGYAVIYINPRGSDGYSEEFADIRGRYGTRDYEDLIEGVRYVVDRYRVIDPSRIGVTGISYGGFMTNWIITHTDIFKAAVSQNGISSWEAEFGTTDIGFYFVPDQIGGDVVRGRERLVEKSPIYYADRVSTPVLFIHSMNDYRCYIDQSLSFHTALKYLGKESAIALFREGSHTFGWVGKPRSRLKRYKLILDWFDRHLKA